MNRKVVTAIAVIVPFAIVMAVFVAFRERGKSSKPSTPPPTHHQLGPIHTTAQVSIRMQTGYLVAPDGSLWCWGNDPVDNAGATAVPRRIGTDTDWASAAGTGAGMRFVVALKSDGSLWRSGGAMGWPAPGAATVPVSFSKVLPGSRWRAVAVGFQHALALRDDGTLWTWGDNSCGQLGDGSGRSSATPIQIGNDTNWTAIAADRMSSFGITSDGTLWLWGHVGFTQTGPNTFNALTQVTPLQYGTNNNWAGISGTGDIVTAAKTDGSRWVFRNLPSSGMGASTFDPADAPGEWRMVAPGMVTCFGIRPDGSLWSWTDPMHPGAAQTKPQRVGNRNDWVDIWTDGYGQTQVGLTADGQLWSWGLIIGMPPQTNLMTRAQEMLVRRFGLHFGMAGTFPMAKDPWVIMRFTTNDSPSAVEPASSR